MAAVLARVEELRALCCERDGDSERAIGHYERAQELVGSDPIPVMVEATVGQARCLNALGDSRYAVHVLESLLSRLDREGIEDPNLVVRVHATLILLYFSAELFDQAFAAARRVLELAPRVDDPLRVAQMHIYVARAYLQRNAPEEAEKSLARAEDLFLQLELKAEYAGARLARGYVLAREGRLDEATAELRVALAAFEETHDKRHIVRALNELGRVERIRGEERRAALLLKRSISIGGETDASVTAWAHRELALVVMRENPVSAEKHLRKAISLYERCDKRVESAITHAVLGDLLRQRGRIDEGVDVYRAGLGGLSGDV